jgi:carboxylesterase type B
LNQSEQEVQYYNALKLSGCESVTCLRGLPIDQLETLNQAVQNASYPGPGVGYGVYNFGPVVDGKFIQELPGLAFQLGHFYDVPLIVDRDGYEGYIFSNMSTKTQVAETTDAEDMFPFGGPAFFSRLYQLYPRSSYNSTFFQRQTWFGDFIINCPTYYMGFNAVERNTNRSAVWKLVFKAGTQLHGATGAFLASNTTSFPGANNQTLAEWMSSYWISFAVTGDPNPMRTSDAPYWQGYMSGGDGSVANGESVGFSIQSVTYTTVGPAPDPDVSEKCEFFGAHVSTTAVREFDFGRVLISFSGVRCHQLTGPCCAEGASSSSEFTVPRAVVWHVRPSNVTPQYIPCM